MVHGPSDAALERDRTVASKRAGRESAFGAVAEVALPVGAALLVTTASASGAYFATSWGWIGVLLCWLTAVGLAVRREVVLSKFELASLATLAGFVGWVAFSLVWSEDVPGTVLEIQRDLVYPVALLTVLLFGRSKGHLGLLAGLTAGITAVCVYSLATRLFPGALLGEFDPTAPISGYRLNDPLGYWNSLAIFAAMGLLLALGFVAESRSTRARALAGAALVILLPTLYFTFSRGGWIALSVGVVGALAVAPRRLRLATIALAMAPWPVLAVFIGSRFEALTTPGKTVAQVTREGHRLALVIALLAVGAAATAAATRLVEARLPRGPALRRAWAAVLALDVVGVLADGPDRVAAAVDRIVTAWREGRSEILAASYGDVRGHPVLLARSVWERIPDEGARAFEPILVPCDDLGFPGDVDVPVDLPESLRPAESEE